jgi:hypothetical protein
LRWVRLRVGSGGSTRVVAEGVGEGGAVEVVERIDVGVVDMERGGIGRDEWGSPCWISRRRAIRVDVRSRRVRRRVVGESVAMNEARACVCFCEEERGATFGYRKRNFWEAIGWI